MVNGLAPEIALFPWAYATTFALGASVIPPGAGPPGNRLQPPGNRR